MRKKTLQEIEAQEEAFQMHNEVLRREMHKQGTGTIEAAMFRLQYLHGLDYWRQWKLRYRHSACSDFITKLRQVRLDILAKSVRVDLEYLKTETKKSRTGDADIVGLLAEGEGLLAKIYARKSRL